MTLKEVFKKLEEAGTDQNRKIYKNHGADLDLFGVSMKDSKTIAKQIKNKDIGLDLLHSKNIDAIYLSRFVVDPYKVKIEDLEKVLDQSNYYLIIDHVVAYLAAKNKDIAFEVLDKWLGHKNHRYRQAGYSLYSYMVMSYDDDLLDQAHIKKTISHIKDHIHQEENRVRYSMNGFLLNVGITLSDFTREVMDISKSIGKVHVHMGQTACKVPFIEDYIHKTQAMNKIGIKRKLG